MFWNKKVAKKERVYKELLRENLGTVVIDMFYGDDPLLVLGETDRKLYLKKFYDLYQDKDVMSRIAYLVNKQANLTLKSLKESNSDESNMAGAMNINGLCLIRDEIQRLAQMYLKENIPDKNFDKFSVV